MAGQNPFLEVIRVWAGLAWADDIIAPEEATAMKKLISSANLDDGEQAIALGYLDSKVELDVSSLRALNENARTGIYKAAARLAMVDREFSPQERTFLDKLRDGLGLSAEASAEIESDIQLPE